MSQTSPVSSSDHLKAYIIRGPAASGKSTLSKLLAQRLGGRVALLEHDLFRWRFHLGTRKVSDVAPDEHVVAFENLISVIGNYAANGTYTIVVDGLFSYGPKSEIERITGVLRQHNYETHSFLLSGARELLWERNCKREYVVPRAEFDELYDHVMWNSGTNMSEKIIDVSLPVEKCFDVFGIDED